MTRYGITTGVQRRIAAIRTDLDVFHDVEALSLMASGYKMAAREFATQLSQVTTARPVEWRWDFLAFEHRLTNPSARLLGLLDISSRRLLKVWRAVPVLSWAGRVLVGSASLAALTGLIALLQSARVISVSAIAQVILLALIGWVGGRWLNVRIPNWEREVAFVAMALTGSILARLHARYLDPAYLRAGRRDTV